MARRRYQTGRIFVRGKLPVFVGRWRADVIQPDGTIRRRERSVVLGPVAELKTEKNARRSFEPILAEVNSPDYRPSKFAKFRDFADSWEAQILAHQKPSSVKAAKSHLKTYIRPWLGDVRLEEFTRQAQQNFVTRVSKRVSASRKYVLNILGTLSSMLRTAKAWGYCCQPIVMHELALPTETVRKRPRSFTGEEAKRIIEFASEPYRTMFAIAAMSGLRIGEIVALQHGDLDFAGRVIHVERSAWYGRVQTVKGPASQAPVAMSEALAMLLTEYLTTWRPNQEGFLFLNRNGRPYAANKVLEYGLWPVLDALQIQRGYRCGLHSFRRGHASLLYDVGAPPTVTQEQMRHADARVTLGIYGRVIGDAQKNAVDKVGEIVRPNAPKSEKSGAWIQ